MNRQRMNVPVAVVLAGLVVSGTACGSRLDDEVFSAQNGTAGNEFSGDNLVPGDVPAMDGDTEGAPLAETPTGETPVSGGGAPASTPARPGTPSGPSARASTDRSDNAAGRSPAPASAANPSTPAQPRAGEPTAQGAAEPTVQEAAPAGGTVLRLGFVGTTSGIIGATVGASLPAVQAWVETVNAAGGIKGHPIKLFAADDGADPSRHRRLVQEMVERDKVIAFPFMPAPFSGHGGVDYLTQKRIPVTGDNGAGGWFYDSPMYFPQMSTGAMWVRAMIHAAAAETVPQGKTKFAMLPCHEAQFCVDANRLWPEEAPKVGYELVFGRQASIAQPDYTAECLGARNAGADVLAVAMDHAAVSRVASSCARVGYQPIYLIHHSGQSLDMAQDPNLDGVLVPVATRAWFESSNPSVAAYQKALARYAAGATSQPVALSGWAGGQLFQLAAERAPDPTTSAGILEGLWSLNGETLGDLTLPLKFNRDQNAPQVSCWFTVRANKGKWEYTQGGSALKCIK